MSFQLIQGDFSQFSMKEWKDCVSLKQLEKPEGRFTDRSVLLWDCALQLPNMAHSHSFFEIIYIFSGSCIYRIGKTRVKLKAGDFMILSPHTHHELYSDSTASVITLTMKPELFRGTLLSLLSGADILSAFLKTAVIGGKTERYLLYHISFDRRVENGLELMLREMDRKDEYSDSMVVLELMQLFLRIARRYGKSARIIRGNDAAEKIMRILYEQYKTITLGGLAKQLHYTVPYCSKYVKNVLGCTFSSMLQKIRFQNAGELLSNSDLPVSEVAQEIGYENMENFFRAFKKYYHMTPSQYRVEMQKEPTLQSSGNGE